MLNKIDLVSTEARSRLEDRYASRARGGPVAVAVSGLARTGLDDLLAAIDGALLADPLVEAKFCVPQSEGAALAALDAGAVVSRKTFAGNLCSLPRAGRRRFWTVTGGFASGAIRRGDY